MIYAGVALPIVGLWEYPSRPIGRDWTHSHASSLSQKKQDRRKNQQSLGDSYIHCTCHVATRNVYYKCTVHCQLLCPILYSLRSSLPHGIADVISCFYQGLKALCCLLQSGWARMVFSIPESQHEIPHCCQWASELLSLRPYRFSLYASWGWGCLGVHHPIDKIMCGTTQ